MSEQSPNPGGYPGPEPGPQPPQYPSQPQQQYPPAPSYPQQPGYPPAYGYPPQAGGYGAPTGQRPGKLTAAAVLTWVGAGLMLFLFVLVLIGGLVLPQDELDQALREELDGQPLPFSMDALRQGLVIGGLIGSAWCVAACVFAGMMLKRKNGARIMLAVSAGATILLSVLSITAIVPLLFAGAAVAVLVLIFNGEVNAWFRGEAPGGMPPYQQQPYQQPYPPQQQPPQQPPRSPNGPW